MSGKPIARCDFCDVPYYTMKDSLQHLQSKSHKEKVAAKTGMNAPDIVVSKNKIDYSEEDQMKATNVLRQFTTSYHICTADQPFAKFVKDHNLFPEAAVKPAPSK